MCRLHLHTKSRSTHRTDNSNKKNRRIDDTRIGDLDQSYRYISNSGKHVCVNFKSKLTSAREHEFERLQCQNRYGKVPSTLNLSRLKIVVIGQIVLLAGLSATPVSSCNHWLVSVLGTKQDKVCISLKFHCHPVERFHCWDPA